MEAGEIHQARVYLVCLMPNHFHLLLETPAGNLSELMGRLLSGYAIYFNLRHGRVGHLTQGRYKAQVVEGNEYLLKLSRYIHLNPVCGQRWSGVSVEERRERLREYRWSTYRSYAGLESEWGFIDYGPVKALVKELGVSYGQYVETGLARDDEEFQMLYQQARLSVGSEEFTAGVRVVHERTCQQARRREDAALRRRAAARSVEETVAAVAGAFGVEASALRRRTRNSLMRGAAVWALVHYAGLTEREAAVNLNIGTGAAASQQLAKWRRKVEESACWSKLARHLGQKLGPANF